MATAGAAGAAQAQFVRPSYGAVFDSVNTVRLADGIYAFISPDSRSAFVSGNSLLVVGHNAALVVDAGHFPSLTRRVIAAETSSLDAARLRIDLGSFRAKLAGDDPYLGRAFDRFFLSSAVERAWEDARRRERR